MFNLFWFVDEQDCGVDLLLKGISKWLFYLLIFSVRQRFYFEDYNLCKCKCTFKNCCPKQTQVLKNSSFRMQSGFYHRAIVCVSAFLRLNLYCMYQNHVFHVLSSPCLWNWKSSYVLALLVCLKLSRHQGLNLSGLCGILNAGGSAGRCSCKPLKHPFKPLKLDGEVFLESWLFPFSSR